MDNHKKPDVISNFQFPISKFQDSGFTFIEVIIAISVMVIGIVGTLLAVQYAISSTTQSYSRLTAAYLAQEGIEIVRDIRDGNWLEQRTAITTPWDEGLTSCSTGCETDYNNFNDPGVEDPTLQPYQGRFLKIDPNAGFYNYSSGNNTQFKRKITIEELATSTLEVMVTVYWGEGKHSIVAQENLYNWRSDH